jgi:hypothetical protein
VESASGIKFGDPRRDHIRDPQTGPHCDAHALTPQAAARSRLDATHLLAQTKAAPAASPLMNSH